MRAVTRASASGAMEASASSASEAPETPSNASNTALTTGACFEVRAHHQGKPWFKHASGVTGQDIQRRMMFRAHEYCSQCARNLASASRRRDFTVPNGKDSRLAMAACGKSSKNDKCTTLRCSSDNDCRAASTWSSACVRAAALSGASSVAFLRYVRDAPVGQFYFFAPQPVDPRIARDDEYPGGRLGFEPIICGRAPPHRHHRILSHILRNRARRPEAQQIRLDLRRVSSKQRPKGAAVALPDAVNKSSSASAIGLGTALSPRLSRASEARTGPRKGSVAYIMTLYARPARLDHCDPPPLPARIYLRTRRQQTCWNGWT